MAATGTTDAKAPMNIRLVDAVRDLHGRMQDGTTTTFRVKGTTKVHKLLAAYCSKTGKPENTVRLMHDGNRMSADKTIFEHGIEDNDQIDVMRDQEGGAQL